MTLDEVFIVIKAHNERKEDELKEQAHLCYMNALIGGMASGYYHPMSDTKHDFPPIEDFFPSLFNTEELKEQREQVEKEAALLKAKSFLLMFANEHNRQYKGGEK